MRQSKNNAVRTAIPKGKNDMEKTEAALTFEAAMQRLEEITRRLEASDTSLDDSLELYKEGVELIRLCNAKLDEAQQKITVVDTGEKER